MQQSMMGGANIHSIHIIVLHQLFIHKNVSSKLYREISSKLFLCLDLLPAAGICQHTLGFPQLL